MSHFDKLLVWRKAHAISVDVHPLAAQLRGPEAHSLRSQIVRCAASVPTNIVEGRASLGEREFARFVGYAISSNTELEYHLLSARDKRLLPASEVDALIARTVEVRMMLYGLLRKLRES